MTRPLTVVQLVPELNVGGVERGTLEIAQALTASGQRAIVVSAPGGELLPQFESCGAEHVALAIGAKRLSTLGCIGALRALFREREVDIVHARSRLPAWVGLLALRGMPAAARPVWITTVHGPYTVNLYSRIMCSGDAVIAISVFIRDYIEENYPGVDAAAVTVIPRGADRARYAHGFQPDAAWLSAWEAAHPALRHTQILTLPARLTRWKGQLDFIELIAELRWNGRTVHGLIVGGAHGNRSKFERELRRTVAERGLEPHISFLGHRSDVREILAMSDVACSLTAEPEAFGRTTVEALSLGVPVLGYDHGGTGEILAQVYPAGLTPRGDIPAAVATAQRLLDAAPHVPAEHPFTVARMQADTLALYRRLVDS